MTIPSVEEIPADEDAHKRLVLIEAEMLLHHTAETLLRMFFAHAAEPEVPWIELDRFRGPGQFTKELKARFRPQRTTRLQGDIAYVFLGSRKEPDGLDDAAKAERHETVDRIAEYLRYYAEILLTRSTTYNAAKHGLSVQAGEPAIKIADVAGLSAEGPAISHLDKAKRDGGGREWVVKTRWIQLEQDLSFAFLGSKFLKALWLVARVRYVRWPKPDEGVFVPSISVKQLLEAGHDDNNPRSMIAEVAFPPLMHSPPGSGVESLIAELDES